MILMICQGRVLNPATDMDEIADILIEDGIVRKIGPKLNDKADQTISAKGCFVMPGFIDMHVHLRDPGQEQKENVETGTRAAARGGYTTIVAMPNTKPVVDNIDVWNYVTNKAKNLTKVHVLQTGSLTKGMEGKQLTNIREMVKGGAKAFSEDGKSVMNAKVCRDAMRVLAETGVPFLDHCEDKDLVEGGVMNADENAVRFGLPGITNSVENTITARDIMLAKETGVHLHLCHCSTKESVQMIECGKGAGTKLSAEVCPHHFILTSDDIQEGPGMTNYKMNPPLRQREDVEALRRGLKEGIIDVIATDHAPHTYDEKNVSMKEAPFGIVGLETAASLTYSELVLSKILTPLQMAEKMSYNPAKLLNIDRGIIAEGKAADLVIFNPDKTYTIDAKKFKSKGKNTPFQGRQVTGQVVLTMVDGEIIYNVEDEKK